MNNRRKPVVLALPDEGKFPNVPTILGPRIQTMIDEAPVSRGSRPCETQKKTNALDAGLRIRISKYWAFVQYLWLLQNQLSSYRSSRTTFDVLRKMHSCKGRHLFPCRLVDALWSLVVTDFFAAPYERHIGFSAAYTIGENPAPPK